VAANHGLGVLVIDEIQRLSRGKSGGAERMLNFFVQLSNTIGIPVVLVGTFKARHILSGAVHQIRRGAGQGDMVWDRMPEGEWVNSPPPESPPPEEEPENAEVPGVWQVFLEALWRYQYIRTPCPLTEDLANALYEETQGITDFAAKVFMLAQARAITTSKDGKEELTRNIIRSVALDSLQQAQPVLEALRNGDQQRLEAYDDMRHLDITPYLKESIQAQLPLMPIDGPLHLPSAQSRPPIHGDSLSLSPVSKSAIKTKSKAKKKPKSRRVSEDDLRHTLIVSKATEATPAAVLSESGRIGSATEYLDESEAA
jgi:hypothetical protein